jgi:hypothetical protein
MNMLKRVLLQNFCTTCIENIVPRFEYKLATRLTFVLFMKALDGPPGGLVPYMQTSRYSLYTIEEYKTKKIHLSFNKLFCIIKGTRTRT